MSFQQSIPQHVAIIMDGNRRWANNNNVSLIQGHKAGAEAAFAITKSALSQGVKYLTLYTFSVENWQRDAKWLDEFFYLLKWYLETKIEELQKAKIRFNVIGDQSKLPPHIQTLIKEGQEKTQHNHQFTLTLALSYSGRDEIVRAVNKIINRQKELNESFSGITVENFSSFLDTFDIPDPDLLIRTSGEKRISNFLLWQLAYTEFIFVDAFWPDFTIESFKDALNVYATRNRRYGTDKL